MKSKYLDTKLSFLDALEKDRQYADVEEREDSSPKDIEMNERFADERWASYISIIHAASMLLNYVADCAMSEVHDSHYMCYIEGEDLIEDVIVENKQAIEMANIYSGILNGTMDTFASVISNNQNSVMKFLTTITIVLSIPTMIASFYGMNVKADGMPFATIRGGFIIVIGISLIISLIIALIFRKKDLF